MNICTITTLPWIATNPAKKPFFHATEICINFVRHTVHTKLRNFFISTGTVCCCWTLPSTVIYFGCVQHVNGNDILHVVPNLRNVTHLTGISVLFHFCYTHLYVLSLQIGYFSFDGWLFVYFLFQAAYIISTRIFMSDLCLMSCYKNCEVKT